MTNKKDEALKVAREALEKTIDVFRDTEGSYGQIENDALDSAYKAITAIKEALAEQPAQQAPAGSVYRYGKDSSGKPWHGIRWTASGLDLPDGTLIYTSPQPSEQGEHNENIHHRRIQRSITFLGQGQA